jgi:hypothetical protein
VRAKSHLQRCARLIPYSEKFTFTHADSDSVSQRLSLEAIFVRQSEQKAGCFLTLGASPELLTNDGVRYANGEIYRVGGRILFVLFAAYHCFIGSVRFGAHTTQNTNANNLIYRTLAHCADGRTHRYSASVIFISTRQFKLIKLMIVCCPSGEQRR